jgi:hypothetical protein
MQLQNGVKLHMQLWFVTTINLDENEKERSILIIEQLVASDDRWKFYCFHDL